MHPISYLQALILGLTQGIAEPFPISSLGHGVIIPSLFGWNIHQNDDYFLAFLVATHCATALVLFFYFLRDWVRIFRGFVRSVRGRGIAPGDDDARLAWLLIVGTIPAGILGLALQHPLRSLFASARDRLALPDPQRDPAARLRAAAPAAPRKRRRRGRLGPADRPPRQPPAGGGDRHRAGGGADPRHLALRG